MQNQPNLKQYHVMHIKRWSLMYHQQNNSVVHINSPTAIYIILIDQTGKNHFYTFNWRVLCTHIIYGNHTYNNLFANFFHDDGLRCFCPEMIPSWCKNSDDPTQVGLYLYGINCTSGLFRTKKNKLIN